MILNPFSPPKVRLEVRIGLFRVFSSQFACSPVQVGESVRMRKNNAKSHPFSHAKVRPSSLPANLSKLICERGDNRGGEKWGFLYAKFAPKFQSNFMILRFFFKLKEYFYDKIFQPIIFNTLIIYKIMN